MMFVLRYEHLGNGINLNLENLWCILTTRARSRSPAGKWPFMERNLLKSVQRAVSLLLQLADESERKKKDGMNGRMKRIGSAKYVGYKLCTVYDGVSNIDVLLGL